MPWDRVHAEAEVLEHVLSEELERADRRAPGRPDGRSARRSDPDRRVRDRRAPDPQPGRAHRSGAPGASFACPTPTRRCCATWPSRASRSALASRSSIASRSVGRCSCASASASIPIGGELARAMRIETEPEMSGDAAAAARRSRARGRRRGRTIACRSPRTRGSPARSSSFSPRVACARRWRCSVPRSSPRSPMSTPATSPPTSQGGAKYGYLLLWVVLLANLMAMLIQYLSAKLGIVTDHNLPQVVRERTSPARSPGACGSRPRSWRCRPTSPSSSAPRSG